MNLRSILTKDKKPDWASTCTAVYTDRKGRKYYRYNDEMDMCVYRKGEIDKCLLELQYGSDYRDVMQGIVKLMSQSDKRGNVTPNISGTAYLAQEIIDRDQWLILPDILMRTCANTLIREDENPYIVDQEILTEKVDTFTAEIQRGGLHAFFHETGLLRLIGLSDTSTSKFKSVMISSEIRHQKHREIAKSILSSE